MSYFLKVFCQSPQLVHSNEITDFIQDGCYFDEKPHFELSKSESLAEETNWKSITVHYQMGKRPVIIERNVNDSLLRQEVSETIKSLQLSGQPQPSQELVHKLSVSKQVIAIEIDPLGLTDDCWVMLDCLNAHLASSLSGIVYAPDDGFYNCKLQPIYKL